MRAINLKAEYLKNPIGIDIKRPRFFWNCEGGVAQTAYQIKTVDADSNLLWDSGKVNSSQMTHIDYPLDTPSRMRVYWSVKLWDEDGNEGEWSDTAFFEIGLRKKSDWLAKWITGNYKVNKKQRYPVDCFKKEFTANENIKSARLYMSACGLYSVNINGSEIAMPLSPGVTDYRKRVQYQTYDVTALIQENNSIEAQLADGWYRGSVGSWGLRNQYGTQTKLLAQLEIIYSDATKQTVITDESWQWSNDGAIRFADNKDGEIVDANRKPSYSSKALVTSHDAIPTCSNNVLIAEKETFKGEMSVTPSGKRLIDFKQNLAGYVSFKINAKAGQKIVLRFGEMLDGGELTLRNIQCTNKKLTTPLQKIEYVCKDGLNEYKTKFAIFGFEYMEIDTDIDIKADDFTAIAVYSDMEETGFFDSSNELLNKLVAATKWSTKSNSTDLPTDCPTRERHGWTGDAQIFYNTASYLFDYATFSKKYLNDMYGWQKKSGRLPQIVPYGGVDFYMWTMNGSVGWSDAGILIPYRFYKIFGDKSILEDYYGGMKKFTEFMIKRCGKTGFMAKRIKVSKEAKKYLVNAGQSYGEWAEPADVYPNRWTDMIAPHPEVSTAYTAYVLEIMAEISALLGKNADSERYKSISAGCKKAYQELVETKDYSLDTDRQAQLVRPLDFDLLNEKQTEFAKKRLIKALDNYDWRLGTGFLSTPLILDVLSEINIDYAYKLLENEKMPGWLFMTKTGATTIWESWEGTFAQGGIASLNHYSKGAVCEWLFKSMCGINVDGKNHFSIKPLAGGSFTYANAEYKSIFGTVKSGWSKKSGKLCYEIEIPSNCTADIIFPDGTSKSVTAGKYSF